MALITSYCDAMRTNEHQMALITSECVPADPDYPVDCGSGLPPTCSVDCAQAFLPLWKNCREELSATGVSFQAFATKCQASQEAGADAQCGYVELLPITMTCSSIEDVNGDGVVNNIDFCASACFSHLRVYVQACYDTMPAFARTFIEGLQAQMDQCNGGTGGSSSTDLGAACDVYSIENACSLLDYQAMVPALADYNQRLKECDDAGAGGGALGGDYDCTNHVSSPQLETLCESNCAQLVIVAVGETVILLHPPLPLAGFPIGMERERQQNDSLADG